MRASGRFFAFLSLSIVCICACKAGTQAPTPQTTINAPQGGKIVYGTVDGATTQAAAMTKLLSTVHTKCGEKPQIGKVFQFRGTNSVGVFFTVTDHPEGNIPLAGMVIAAAIGPNQVEGAMLYDVASRFGQTVNPMLQQLSSVWHPGATPSRSGTPGGSGKASTSSAPTKSPVPLHAVTAPDNSATISIPDGWKMDPQQSGRGAIIVRGPNGEQLAIDMIRNAVDPTNPFQVNMAQRHLPPPPGSIVYPFRGDIEKDFVNLFQAWRRAGGQGPAPIQVDKLEPEQAAQGNHCVHATGHMNPDGKGMQAFNDLMCAIDPIASFGGYSVMLDHSLLPSAVENKEQDLLKAIVTTYKQNSQVVNQQMAEQMKEKQQSDKQIQGMAQNYIGQIHQLGQQATARMNASEAADSAEQASWNAGQDANAKNTQGFSNYLLDQSVVQNNSTGGHATVWNSTAEGLVKADPNRFQVVDTPNYIKDTDY